MHAILINLYIFKPVYHELPYDLPEIYHYFYVAILQSIFYWKPFEYMAQIRFLKNALYRNKSVVKPIVFQWISKHGHTIGNFSLPPSLEEFNQQAQAQPQAIVVSG